MKVKKIQKDGFADFRRILEGDYKATQKEFYSKYDIELPDLDLTSMKGSSDIRVLLNDLRISVVTSEGLLYYKLQKGFITDFASVPKWLRSLVDNDSSEIVVPALVHDVNFRWKFLSFGRSNKVFRQMIRKSGGSWWLAFKAYIGVSNPFGREAYNFELDKKYKRTYFEWRPK